MNITLTRSLLILTVLAIVGLSPLSAQIASFSAEVDCDAIVAPGGSVPYTVRIENQTLNNIPLDVSVEVQVPGMGTVPLVSGSTNLGPNQDLLKNLTLNLPMTAPISNNYQIVFTASSATETSFDTCSFKVQ